MSDRIREKEKQLEESTARTSPVLRDAILHLLNSLANDLAAVSLIDDEEELQRVADASEEKALKSTKEKILKEWTPEQMAKFCTESIMSIMKETMLPRITQWTMEGKDPLVFVNLARDKMFEVIQRVKRK